MRHVLTLCATLVVVLAGGAHAGAGDPPNPAHARVRPPVSYLRYCSACHGSYGDGDGVSAHRFDTAASDLTRGQYKCRTTPAGSPPTDHDLRRTIDNGLFGTGMPGFLALSPLEIGQIVRFLQQVMPVAQATGAAQPIAIPAEPPDDAASVARGAQTYARLQCNSCHGSEGRGTPSDSKLRNDDGTTSHAPALTDPARFKCGSSSERLYVTLMTGLDGTPMASYAEVAEPSDVWDVVHFIESLEHAAQP